MKKIKFYKVKEKYIMYLNQYDKRIAKCYGDKAKRPFIGIVLEINNTLYFAPFTSPKEKHLKMKNTIDFLKIDKGRLGAINFNNMIPIPLEECELIDIENEENENYRNLLYKQIDWCNEKNNINIILNKAQNLYYKVINNKLPERIIKRCCDFKVFEEKSKKY